ncbi:MAG TPA: signal peptidase I [Acidimicrobiales bacterium]
MRRKLTKIVLTLLVAVLFLGLWIFFAPTKLGGSSTYTVTSGVSMQPLLFKGDLAVVRSEPSYHVGDIVLYNSAVLHAPVLHRIFKIQNGNYFFKGDNNSFVDPGYATRAELVGKLWFHIPKVGGFISWFGKPVHSAVLAALAAMAVVLSLGQTKSRTRRRHRSSSQKRNTPIPDFSLISAPLAPDVSLPTRQLRDATLDSPLKGVRMSYVKRQARSATSSSQAISDRRPSFLEGPLHTLLLVTTFVLIAVLCLGIGLTRPLKHLVPVTNAYQQSGSFSYSAIPTKKTQVYPKGVVKTGDPIYPSLVKDVTFRYNYMFTSSLPHKIKGTLTFRVLVLSQTNTWQQPFVIKTKTPFQGETANLVSTFPLSEIYSLVNNVNTQTGSSGTSYTADLQPVVHITGTVGDMPINETFSPVLPFSITQQAITLNVAVTPAPPGATYVAPSAASQLALTLRPSVSGTVLESRTNTVSFAKYAMDISFLRVLGGLFFGVALLVLGIHERLRRRMIKRSDEEITARQLRLTIIPVTSLEMAAGFTPIEVPDFRHLGDLARFLDRPILYENNAGSRTYAVDDDTRRYIFRPVQATFSVVNKVAAAPQVAASVNTSVAEIVTVENAAVTANASRETASVAKSDRKSHGPSGKKQKGARRVNVTQAVIGLLALAVILTLSTSFTSSSDVAASTAGVSVQARTISQLAPAGCSSLSLVSLVRGSGTFSNALSNALILESAGNDTLTDTGNDNCIVGGGGTNYVTGPTSDICVTGPTLNIAGACTSPSNGVTATPTTSNVSGYAGQENLAIANTSSITAMKITISIVQTTGVTFSSESNGFPYNTITQNDSTSGGVITYTFTLKSGKTIPAGNSGDTVAANYSATGSAHPLTGDTWSVTSTSGGTVSTISGNF